MRLSLLLLPVLAVNAVAGDEPGAARPPVQSNTSASRPWPTAPPTKFPTGVVSNRIPSGASYQTHGVEAQRFVVEALGYGGDGVDDSEEPWLVLFGPPDATNQIRDAVPSDVAQKIQFAAYDPETDEGRLKMKELKVSAGGRGVKAIVMDAGGNVAYEGIFDMDEVLAKLRKLLGVGPPDDEPDDGGSNWPIPNPFRSVPFWMTWTFWGGVAAGAAVVKFLVPLFQILLTLGPAVSEIKLIADEVKKRRDAPK